MSTLKLRRSIVFPILGGTTTSLFLFGVLLSTFFIVATPVRDADAFDWAACLAAAAACGVAKAAEIVICGKFGSGSGACVAAKGVAAAACHYASQKCN